ncbi:MAG TPA: magnesium transporter [Clostridiaceae bacterium]|nr:magnesium transporter [Clostridiaceae bacterium]
MDVDLENALQLLSEKNYSALREELKNAQSADIADMLNILEEKNALIVFRLLPKEIAADVFSYLSTDKQAEIFELINEKELTDILSDLYFDDKIDLLEEMPANVVKRILKHTSDVERKLINQFLMYPEYSAGSLMTIEFVDLKKEMLVGDALEKIRRTAPDKETIYTCYVIDAERHLEGIVSLKDLVLSSVDKKVGEIMHKDPIFVKTHDDREYTADVFKKYDLLAVPVVDNEKRLVGIITIDDIVDVIEEENTEDFMLMAAVQPTGEGYLDAGILTLAKKRVVWLLILMISATITGYIIRKFEGALQSVVVLASFIPMLMDTGGNAGSQASTTVIRSIVLGEIESGDYLKVIWKEIRVSFIIGIILSSINFLRILLIEHQPILITLTVTITLLFTVVIAKTIGGILPLLAKKLKLDPAIMASPLVTTIVDAVTLAIYFSLAVIILRIKV